MSLKDLIKHLYRVYSRQNSVLLPGYKKRIDFLNISAGDVQEAVRKNAKKYYGITLARVFARSIGVAESLKAIQLHKQMSTKYPKDRCSYCGKKPCKCEKDERPEPTYAKRLSVVQIDWSLTNWQDHCGAIYGENNLQEGIGYLVSKVFKEICELSNVETEIPFIRNIGKIEEQFAFEISDVIAWVCGCANYLDVDLEKAVLNRYHENGCWACHNWNKEKNYWECDCGYVDYRPMTFD